MSADAPRKPPRSLSRLVDDARQVARWAKAGLQRERVRLKNRLLIPPLRLVFHPGYATLSSELIDGQRATRILSYLRSHRWITADQVFTPGRARTQDLVRAHSAEYLARLDQPEELLKVFGGVVDPGPAAARVLDAQRLATSGTVTATRLALDQVALSGPVVNLGGGFHHAARTVGGGFCAFNDVAVAVEHVRARGFTGRVLVVDLDAHQGDGTRSIYAEDERVFTLSLHGRHWDTSPAVASMDVALGPAVGDATYLAALRPALDEAFARARPELIFYVAGVDIADGDPLGGFRVSPAGILERDRLVLTRARGVPTVVVLAGGYGPQAWRPTTRMLLWLLAGEDVPIPSGDELALDRFRLIRRSLPSDLLRGSDEAGAASAAADRNFGLTESDLLGDLRGTHTDGRFLGYYTRYGLEVACERYGLAAHLRSRGYEAFEVTLLDEGGSGLHRFRVSTVDGPTPETLIEVSVADRSVDGLRCLSVEWLLLQDPRRAPRADEPLLPGQAYPGLGCLRIVIGMLVMAAERLGFDGVTVVPSHFHVAVQAKRLMSFLDPRDEAYFLAVRDATRGLSLLQASNALANGKLRDTETGEPLKWRPRRLVVGVSAALRQRLSSDAYAAQVEAAARSVSLSDAEPPAPG